jgi:hypothetical protein
MEKLRASKSEDNSSASPFKYFMDDAAGKKKKSDGFA